MFNLRNFLIVSLSILMVSASAQFSYTDATAKAHEAILQLNFKTAEQVTTNQVGQSNGFYYWLKSYSTFVQYLTSSEELNIQELIQNFDINIEKLKAQNPEDPYFHSCLADLYLMKSYLLYSQEDYLTALASYIKAARQIEINQSNFPDFALNSRHQLIVLTAETLIQSVFPVLSNEKKIQEARQKFMAILNNSLTSPAIPLAYKAEMALTGAMCYSFLDDDPQNSYQLVKSYGTSWPSGNPLQSFIFVKNAFRADDFKQGRNILTQAVKSNFNQSLNEINLLMGNTLLNQSNDSAEFYLNKFIINQKNEHDVQYARLKLSWYYFLNQQQAKADSLCALIGSEHTNNSDDDRQAIYECSLTKYWDPVLLKARLMFDGGNFSECRKWLLSNQQRLTTYTEPQKLEFAYRMARTCHKLDDFEHAKTFYLMAIHSGLDKLMYYPCYSAYYLGTIYETEQNHDKAVKYFKLCTEMDSPIYKESIHQKARKHFK